MWRVGVFLSWCNGEYVLIFPRQPGNFPISSPISNCLEIFYAQGQKHTCLTCFLNLITEGLDIQFSILARQEGKVQRWVWVESGPPESETVAGECSGENPSVPLPRCVLFLLYFGHHCSPMSVIQSFAFLPSLGFASVSLFKSFLLCRQDRQTSQLYILSLPPNKQLNNNNNNNNEV